MLGVETVSVMSTRVDKNVLLTLLPVETVSGMSTRVDQQIQSLKLNG